MLYGITPYRTPWGEMAFSYAPAATSTISTSTVGTLGVATAYAAADFAQTFNSNLNFRLMVWPDAESVRQKVALAKKPGMRGVSIFKIDGGEDPNIWSVLK